MTSMAVRAHGAQLFRRVQEEDGSKVDTQLAHEPLDWKQLAH